MELTITLGSRSMKLYNKKRAISNIYLRIRARSNDADVRDHHNFDRHS